MEFEWDPAKEAANLMKHGISFSAAAQVLESGTAVEFQSDRGGELRWLAVGRDPESSRILTVIYTIRQGRCRIISVRRARKNEEREFRERREFGPRGWGN